MIYVTGDVHGLLSFSRLEEFAADRKDLTKNDYMIIAGDCGVAWNPADLQNRLDAYSRLPFTTLFVDGNHENFDILSSYLVEEWQGGKVHKLSNSVIHLMRGQVYEIEGKTFFTLGGATSTDKCFREEGISWWADELPTYADLEEGFKNLAKYGDKVDFVITHACDEKALYYPPLKTPFKYLKAYPENSLLTEIEERVDYGHWYFGHYHEDGDLTDKKTALYESIIHIV